MANIQFIIFPDQIHRYMEIDFVPTQGTRLELQGDIFGTIVSSYYRLERGCWDAAIRVEVESALLYLDEEWYIDGHDEGHEVFASQHLVLRYKRLRKLHQEITRYGFAFGVDRASQAQLVRYFHISWQDAAELFSDKTPEILAAAVAKYLETNQVHHFDDWTVMVPLKDFASQWEGKVGEVG